MTKKYARNVERLPLATAFQLAIGFGKVPSATKISVEEMQLGRPDRWHRNRGDMFHSPLTTGERRKTC
ncbi:hypothetical protein RI103_20215 [Paraburkholderia sp. FT54]|uniref:hypothetical protein n=1 Tax=Paraburkholderia sp. FT54 TaxID=3074437 RepID=UPI002878034D|nr:hypothetical protein [Paraburkholderia sp. FT54]WNC93161.1 hypothetical protein RI103_20215 [Paraburkholderia sp. FT54]